MRPIEEMRRETAAGRRRYVAHHAAGHIVAEWAAGYRIRYAEISDDGHDERVVLWPWSRRTHQEALTAAWAGPVAESRARHVALVDACGDCERRLVDRVAASAARWLRHPWMVQLQHEVAQATAGTFLSIFDAEHAALVEALVEHRRLSGRQARRILRDARRPEAGGTDA